jgi:hypothetical protein
LGILVAISPNLRVSTHSFPDRCQKIQTFAGNRLRDELTRRSIHLQHVAVQSADLGIEVGADGRASRHIGLHDVANNLDGIGILQDGGVHGRLLDDLVPGRIGDGHQVGQQSFLLIPVALGRHHVAAGLVECVNLLRREIAGNLGEVPDDLLDERLVLARLERDKVAPALLGDLDEGIARHVLNT